MTEFIDYHLNPYYDRQKLSNCVKEVKTPVNNLSKEDLNDKILPYENEIAALLISLLKK